MATGENMAEPDGGLDHGRANGAGNVRARNRGSKVDGPGEGRGPEPEASSGDPGRAQVADGEGSAALSWDKDANIHVRMIRAQAMARALETTNPKDARVHFKEYVSHDTVTYEARRILVANGVHFQPFLKSFDHEGNRSKVTLTGRFTNVDVPSEFVEFDGIGFGVDGSDKGPGIAMSYAKKMVLAQALMLNTKEDIEEHAAEFVPAGASQAQRDAEALSEVAVRQWADAYREALRGARALKDLKRIRAENADMMKRVPEPTRDYFVDMIAGLEGALE